ncbi:hypothetical protein [Haloglomus irregulare]|uniref:hypothetical protein n=1 Tax=Haloglomus irregulare TaxID=2234134 RepID=UPI001EE3555A|nr:hypothetical protein [Haloglomus irregulare]
MTLVVPFDGSDLAEAALVRATEFGSVFDEDVLAVSVIPKGNKEYAREHGWIGQDKEFDLKSVVSILQKIKEKAHDFSRGMNPTSHHTIHVR